MRRHATGAQPRLVSQRPAGSASPKRLVFAELARVGSALASGLRLELLDLIAQSPRSVDELARLSAQEVANVSHHLQILRRARLVDVERRGARSIYRLAGEDVGLFLTSLHRLGEERLAEVSRVVRDLVARPREEVDKETLVARVRRGEVTVVDVRPAEEFAAGHLPGALSIPLPDLERRIAELPRRARVVAYCRGPYCVMAAEAVAVLRRRGRVAQVLDEGVWEWRARGLAVVTGEGAE